MYDIKLVNSTKDKLKYLCMAPTERRKKKYHATGYWINKSVCIDTLCINVYILPFKVVCVRSMCCRPTRC